MLKLSAVKCVHAFAVCGYCDLCFGYFPPQLNQRDTAAENQMCPTGTIKRTFVEDPYYQYTIDQSLCVGCGKCVKGCNAMGNGSLFLQIIHGDMSFKEWLRSQGEKQIADEEDRREQSQISQHENRRNELLSRYQSQRGHIPRCVNCNRCSIAVACPAQAFSRVPSHKPYLLKKPKEGTG